MSSKSLNRSGSRRTLIKALTLAPLGPWLARVPEVRAAQERSLAFHHLHTGERLELAYFTGGRYVADALNRINHVLRDFRSGELHRIDTVLLDLLHSLSVACGGGTFEVISGYRSPQTNTMLLETGGVATRSLHMEGRAIDIRLSGCDTRRLRDGALAMTAGGVGYYPVSDFVHVDTGRVRSWTHRG